MSQNNSNAKTAMLAKLDSIHKVEGFDPSPFAVDYTDLNTQETRKRLPVMIQMAWFRLKYPEGRIAIQVSPGKDCFVATARIYPSYRDPVDCYLAEATASRGPDASKPSVSPREWAQTAAVGIALKKRRLWASVLSGRRRFRRHGSGRTACRRDGHEPRVAGYGAACTGRD